MATNKEIKVYRGNSIRLKFTVKDKAGDAFDLSTYNARFAVYKTVEEDPAISLNTSDDPDSVYLDDVDNNVFYVAIRPSATASLSYSFKYVAEVYKGVDDENYTVAFGNFVVQDDGA